MDVAVGVLAGPHTAKASPRPATDEDAENDAQAAIGRSASERRHSPSGVRENRFLSSSWNTLAAASARSTRYRAPAWELVAIARSEAEAAPSLIRSAISECRGNVDRLRDAVASDQQH